MTTLQAGIALVPLAGIWWDNRYRKDLGDIDTLTESVKEKGILQPVTVAPDLELLAGERRVTAARAAGLSVIPALVREKADAIDAREVELIENVFRKDFTWAEESALVLEIDRLYKEKDIDWSGRKTAQLLNKGVASVSRALQLAKAVEVIPELGEYKTADEALKVLKKLEEDAILDELAKRQNDTRQASGFTKGVAAMLTLADHNYLIGDTFKGLAELRSNGVVHLIECDPPYGIDLTKVKASKDSVTSNVHTYHEVDAEGYPDFLEKLAAELYRVAAPSSWMVFWFGPSWQYEVHYAITKAGWQVDDIPCIWLKEHGQTLQPEIYLARTYEPFYMCRKGSPVLLKRGRANVFQYASVPSNRKYHPTQRPVELIQDIIETLIPPNCIILCPFLGSGATIRAAYNAGQKVFGWDISEEYKPKLMLMIEEDAKRLTEPEEA